MLSQKFSSEELRTFAIGRLESTFPRNFTEWEAISSGERAPPVIYNDEELTSIKFIMPHHQLGALCLLSIKYIHTDN